MEMEITPIKTYIHYFISSLLLYLFISIYLQIEYDLYVSVLVINCDCLYFIFYIFHILSIK